MRVPRLLRGRRRLVTATVACVLLVGIAAAGWIVFVQDHGRSPEATVQAFFEARRERDCERLVDLVAVSSWPGGDDLGRRGRVDQCRDVVDADQPVPDRVDVVAEDEDTATVQMSLPVEGDPTGSIHPGVVVTDFGDQHDAGETVTRAHAEGGLVREGGEWRVRLDHSLVHVGRSVEDTVTGFVEAFQAGDCERMTAHLSSAAWSQGGGGLSREAYLDRCAASVAGREDVAEGFAEVLDSLEVSQLAVTPSDDGRLTGTVTWFAAGIDDVALRMDRGEWRLDAPLERIDHLEMVPFLAGSVDGGAYSVSAAQVRLVPPDTPLGVEMPYIEEGGDAVERRREHGFERGLSTTYTGPESHSLYVVLFEFADPEGALAYGELLATRSTQGVDLGSPAPTPSVAEGRAAIVECGGPGYDDCTRASNALAFGVRGRFLVGVNVVDHDGTYPLAVDMASRIEAIIQAELTRLP